MSRKQKFKAEVRAHQHKVQCSYSHAYHVISERRKKPFREIGFGSNDRWPRSEPVRQEGVLVPGTVKAGDCPDCQSRMVLRRATQGTWVGGLFYGCGAYPTCRVLMPADEYGDPAGPALYAKTGLRCHRCAGEMKLIRSHAGSYFFGCSSYPRCSHTRDANEKGELTYPQKEVGDSSAFVSSSSDLVEGTSFIGKITVVLGRVIDGFSMETVRQEVKRNPKMSPLMNRATRNLLGVLLEEVSQKIIQTRKPEAAAVTATSVPTPTRSGVGIEIGEGSWLACGHRVPDLHDDVCVACQELLEKVRKERALEAAESMALSQGSNRPRPGVVKFPHVPMCRVLRDLTPGASPYRAKLSCGHVVERSRKRDHGVKHRKRRHGCVSCHQKSVDAWRVQRRPPDGV